MALDRTTAKRGSRHILTDYSDIIKMIRDSSELRNYWEKYRKEFEYAKEIRFDNTCDSIETIMNRIS